ncbi:MAG: hypothetical protein MHM6MM_002952 [Cercozoa sp. M6MM]
MYTRTSASVKRSPHSLPRKQRSFADKTARRIWNQYLAEEAPLRINLPSQISRALRFAFRHWRDLSSFDRRSVFIDAFTDIKHLMATDSLPKFFDSEIYRNYLSGLRLRGPAS